MELYNENCLERLKKIPDKSIDLIFNDLPYGQTSCKWDSLIDIDELWKQYKRIRKDNTPIFFTCSTKFGHSLISSNMKEFRYDLVWVKSAACGFLNAKKMPMKKHEMLYVFYKKLPFYNLESHTHKFLKETEIKRKVKGECYINRSKTKINNKYEPPLPVSVIKETQISKKQIAGEKNLYGDKGNECYGKFTYYNNGEKGYDPPLPTSVIKTDLYSDKNKKEKRQLKREPPNKYEPPLPVSVIKEKTTDNLCKYDVNKNTYGGGKEGRIKISKDKKDHQQKYEPPLPVSVIKETQISKKQIAGEKNLYGNINGGTICNIHGTNYEPPLPNSILEIKSQKGKHSTQKPDILMEWILKYYSKEDYMVLDPTMGSGSMGVACKKMNRKFIGIEKDNDIFKVAEERINLPL